MLKKTMHPDTPRRKLERIARG
ncbi:protein of unknown function [Azospirillum baldaniorum]|uniref:Uncharacterized protein n=1 Tax=Azospirillum baldaniorum TaxID=1064539 RepID=A0A9P1JNR3_9PROT|nr:protein of unknown function [Azospirillum baldaniorum]